MNPLHDYLCQQLDGLLAKHRLVVFYDPRSEFLAFFNDELEVVGLSACGLPRVSIQERLTFLARFEGSLLALRDAVEPIAGLDKPEPLLIYLPGVERDRQMSVLMELDKAGTTYEPQLRRLARHVLLKQFTDGQIDDMLRPQISYADIVALLQQSQDGAPTSVLRTLFSGAQSETLLSRWLADTSLDASIDAKGAAPELLQLIESRLGLALPPSTSLSAARDKTLRYALINEFRGDIQAEPPASLALVPEPSLKEHTERLRSVAEALRTHHANSYAELADQLETSLGLAGAGIEAEHLGNIDTFRFEEQALLDARGRNDRRRALRQGARRSWPTATAASGWTAGEPPGPVGGLPLDGGARPADRTVRPALAKAPRCREPVGRSLHSKRRLVPGRCPAAPPRDLGRQHGRRPGTSEKALAVVRRDHEELLKQMADGFATALRRAAGRSPACSTRPASIPTLFKPCAAGSPTSSSMPCASRWAPSLPVSSMVPSDLTLRPAIAALPTITPSGMAALLARRVGQLLRR